VERAAIPGIRVTAIMPPKRIYIASAVEESVGHGDPPIHCRGFETVIHRASSAAR
jgi:hypothetical protein